MKAGIKNLIREFRVATCQNERLETLLQQPVFFSTKKKQHKRVFKNLNFVQKRGKKKKKIVKISNIFGPESKRIKIVDSLLCRKLKSKFLENRISQMFENCRSVGPDSNNILKPVTSFNFRVTSLIAFHFRMV